MKTYRTITEQIINKLKSTGETITFAESCTGGRIAAEFTAISGASAVLNGSVITYSNEIKHQWLNVSEQTLLKYGAVSAQCVAEMLTGVVAMSGADYAIAVSGIAGPTGGTPDKPVGTVYIGIMVPNQKPKIYHNLFDGDREQVQSSSVEFAIKQLYDHIRW